MSDPTEAKLSKTERKRSIDKVSIASGLARYALDAKTTDIEAKSMKLSYRDWQARNTQLFNSLDRQQQQLVRERGYCNVGLGEGQIFMGLAPRL